MFDAKPRPFTDGTEGTSERPEKSTMPGWPETVEQLGRIIESPYGRHVPVVAAPLLGPFGVAIALDPLTIRVGDVHVFRTRLAIATDRREIMDRLRVELGQEPIGRAPEGDPVDSLGWPGACDCGRRGTCGGHAPTCPEAPSAILDRIEHVRKALR